MIKTDSIASPSMLLQSTIAKMRETKKNFNPSTLHFEKEGYFKHSKYFKTEKGNTWYATELGDPVPYTLKTDNMLASVLLFFFIIATLSFSFSRNFIVSQLQTFFRAPRSIRAIAENIPQGKATSLLVLLTSLLLGIIFFITWDNTSDLTYNAETLLIKIGIYFGEFIVYFIIKHILYAIVDWTFFEREQNSSWSKSRLFLITVEGVLLFPLVLLLIYFNISLHSALIYSAFVIFFVKILHLYKSYTIFFNRTTISLQIILYFCTLEIIPLMFLLGVLSLTGNYLNINI